ncbi:epimerase family protein SDR39U1 isoform X1 [Ciona intestinalis]
MTKLAVVGGGNGFIGRALANLLQKSGYKALSVSRKPGENTLTWKSIETEGLPKNTEVVINLAGEPVLNVFRRWTPSFKQEIWDSRIKKTKTLRTAVLAAATPPKVWATVSGVGFYPPSTSRIYDELSVPESTDIWSELTHAWENAGRIENENIRHFVVRSGVVLGKNGGAMSEMLPPFKLGLGGPMGDGKQWFPWIHIDDIAGIFMHGVKNTSVRGVLNGVAPEAHTNGEFSKALGSVLSRPALLSLPSFVVKALYGSERSVMLLQGQNVYPKLTLDSGYVYSYPKLDAALKEVISR